MHREEETQTMASSPNIRGLQCPPGWRSSSLYHNGNTNLSSTPSSSNDLGGAADLDQADNANNNNNEDNNDNNNGRNSAAIESLAMTAQSVGLSIEQLAAALAQSENLKVLSSSANNNGDGGLESGSDSQHELALRLYHTESLALYRRCMLLSGFDAEHIEEHAPEYREFAFKAWQEEGQRIQDMMGTDTLEAPTVADLSWTQRQQQEAQQHALEQLQAQLQGQTLQHQAQALALEQQQQQKQRFLLQNRFQQQQQQEEQQKGLHPLLAPQYSDGLQRQLSEMLTSRNQFNF